MKTHILYFWCVLLIEHFECTVSGDRAINKTAFTELNIFSTLSYDERTRIQNETLLQDEINHEDNYGSTKPNNMNTNINMITLPNGKNQSHVIEQQQNYNGEFSFEQLIPTKATNAREKTSVVTTEKPTTTKSEELDPCFDVGTCRFASEMKKRYCQCDSRCVEYQDCCSDAVTEGQEVSMYHDYWRCYNPTSYTKYYGGFFAIGICPHGYDNSTIISKCHDHNIVENGPWVLYNKTVAFVNKYCAICHNVTNFDTFKIEFYNTAFLYKILYDEDEFLHKTRKEKLEFFFNMDSHYILKTESDADLRFCMSSLVTISSRKCNTGSINPVFPIQRRPIFYRNKYCIPSDSSYSHKCVGSNFVRMAELYTLYLYPLSVLFSFEIEETEIEERGNACNVWTSEIQEKGICKNKDVYVNAPLQLSPMCLSTSGNQLTKADFKMVGFIIGWSVQTSNISQLLDMALTVEKNDSVLHLHLNRMEMIKPVFLEELLAFNKQVDNINWTVKFIDHVNGHYTNIQRHKTNDTECTDVMRHVRARLYHYDYIFNSIREANVTFSNQSNDTICSNTTLEIVRQITHDISVSFLPCNNNDLNIQNQNVKRKITIEKLVTYISFSISTVALIILIFINKRFKLTTGIACVNLENVALTISVSDITFMVGIGNSDHVLICYCISILLHYLWLSAFSFMSIAVFFIVKNLTKLRSRIQEQDTYSTRPCYITMTGLFIPFIFVIPSVIIDNIGPQFISPGYGQAVCFPSRFPGNVIFFSGPVILSLVVSLISIIRLVIKVTKLRLDIGQVSKSDAFTNATVFLRILSVSNLFWVFGLLATLIGIYWLKLAFTLICGLQGLFILVASLTTKRFFQLIRASNSVSQPGN